MAAEVLHRHPHFTIYYCDDVRAIHLEWVGFATSREFREASELSLKEMEARGIGKMIADNRAAKAVDPGDQRWLTNDWFPRAIASGFRYSAVILSESALNKYASDHISSEVEGDQFHAHNVASLEEAKAWLEER